MLYIDIPHAFLNIFLFLLAGILSEAGETRFLLWWSHIVVGAVCTVVHCRIDGDAGVMPPLPPLSPFSLSPPLLLSMPNGNAFVIQAINAVSIR